MKQKIHSAGQSHRFPDQKDLATAARAFDVNYSSQAHYKNLAIPKTKKSTGKSCNCTACIDCGFNYDNNQVLIHDDDPLIFKLFGKCMVK